MFDDVAAQKLLAELLPDRAACVAFIIAIGARWSETVRGRREDVNTDTGLVRLRGIKTKKAERTVPIVSFGNPLMDHLRRTCSTRLRQHRVEPHLIGSMLGHTDSRMVERVYGRMPVESLKNSLERRVADCSVFVADEREDTASERPVRLVEPDVLSGTVVPRDGTSPAHTRIFSPYTEGRKGAGRNGEWAEGEGGVADLRS